MTDATIPTLFDYIDFGVRAGLSMNRMLSLYREGGNRIRTEEFAEQFRKHKKMYAEKAVTK